jgi:hypothetical protein
LISQSRGLGDVYKRQRLSYYKDWVTLINGSLIRHVMAQWPW